MKRVLVTGACGGIGSATVQLFLSRGWDVISQVRRVSRECEDALRGSYLVECDFLKEDALEVLAGQATHIDALINNAGIMFGVKYHEYTDAMRHEICRVNLEVPVALMQILGERMAKAGGGRIVNNASIAAHIGHPDVWYGITKAGLLNATKSFARIFGAQGVVVNAVAAGPINTDMLKTIPIERQAAIRQSLILGRFAEPKEMAEIMYWLVDGCPEYVNGSCIDLNNGAFMR